MLAGVAGRLLCKVREVNSGAARCEVRENLLEAARLREIDVVLALGPLRPLGDGSAGDVRES